MSRIRTYSQLRRLETIEERFDYLMLRGEVGAATFGHDRWVNQYFYKSREWLDARDYVILRDGGCDLGVPGYEIHADLVVHHMNPLTQEAIESGDPDIVEPEFLITTSLNTHNAIHFGDKNLLPRTPTVRRPGDTKLW
jgi:hypothetical protein